MFIDLSGVNTLCYFVTALQENDISTAHRILDKLPLRRRAAFVNSPYRDTLPIFHVQSADGVDLLYQAGVKLNKRLNGKMLLHVCNLEVAETAVGLMPKLVQALGHETSIKDPQVLSYILRLQMRPGHITRCLLPQAS